MSNLVYSKHKPGYHPNGWPRHQAKLVNHAKWKSERPQRQASQGVTGIVQWHSSLVEPFAVPDAIVQFTGSLQELQSLSRGPISAVWNLGEFEAEPISDPQWTIV